MKKKYETNRGKKDIIDYVNKDIGVSKNDMRIIYASMERALIKVLSEATDDEPICLRLFAGVYLTAERIQPRTERDPRTGGSVLSRERIDIKPQVSKSFRWMVQDEAGLFSGYNKKVKNDEHEYDDEEE